MTIFKLKIKEAAEGQLRFESDMTLIFVGSQWECQQFINRNGGSTSFKEYSEYGNIVHYKETSNDDGELIEEWWYDVFGNSISEEEFKLMYEAKEE
jgi:hypothetical protein